ncbi:Tat binding protein 1-interacting protein-domain-containing protein [Boeremia exigua]|uniref:Tat binding protein 1-interacting protein-domain-containing protein n=1 Tax=Boeremia exigua TaxID=749465 RepID=UPI001E8E89DE|nr:Tat binding protein 1-interacting protein-domain-containing protein [Boeremia exigua]KAH6637791.1 Tat binding protein 1-interacting protein-domain-containing protein [Boeremia exigua]
MAPRKKTDKPEKEEKATGAEGSDMILRYLRKTNRPYSAIEVSTNLYNKVTKAATAKLLKDLHEQKLIEGRASGTMTPFTHPTQLTNPGKQIVYHALQNPTDAISPDQLADYDARTAALTAQTTDLHSRTKTLRTALAALSAPRAADLLSRVAALEREKEELGGRLEALRAGRGVQVSAEERERVGREWRAVKGVSGRRERIAREFWGMVEEGTEGEEREALREAWGLDE